MIHLSERSTAIAKNALELLLDRLKLTYVEGDDPHIARALDEVSTAISELGQFNNRMSVHYEALREAYTRHPPQAHHINSSVCANCTHLHLQLMRGDNSCFAEAVIDEKVGLGLVKHIQDHLYAQAAHKHDPK